MREGKRGRASQCVSESKRVREIRETERQLIQEEREKRRERLL